jgi:hypothetical protein
MTLSELAGEVDSERHGNLTSAIRLFVLAARHPLDGDLPVGAGLLLRHPCSPQSSNKISSRQRIDLSNNSSSFQIVCT